MAVRPMAHLITVGGVFHARVLAARLGAEGMLTDLRGALGATYPLGGAVHVFVDADQVDAARQVLLADQVDAALPGPFDLAAGPDDAFVSGPNDVSGPDDVSVSGPDDAGDPPGPRGAGRRAWGRLAWALVAVMVALYALGLLG